MMYCIIIFIDFVLQFSFYFVRITVREQYQVILIKCIKVYKVSTVRLVGYGFQLFKSENI
jgi:hypothetical protein